MLGPPIAPTAAALVRRAAGPFTPRNEPGITPRSCGIATCLMRATGTVGLAPTGLWPWRTRPLHIRRPFGVRPPFKCDLAGCFTCQLGSFFGYHIQLLTTTSVGEEDQILPSGRNTARAAVGGEFPTRTLSVVRRDPSSTIAHVSASPPLIPDSRISRVRLAAAAFPRGPSQAPRSLSTRLHTPLGCIVIPPARHHWNLTSLYLAQSPDDVPK